MSNTYQWFGDVEGLGRWAGNLHAAHQRKIGKKLQAGKTHLLPITIVNNAVFGAVIEVDTPTGAKRVSIGDWIVHDDGKFYVTPAGEASS